jgi:FdhD protein
MAARRRVERIGGPGAGTRSDFVVVEEPLQIHVELGETRALLGATMRTPGHDLELAVGLAVGEGVVRSRADVRSVRHCGGSGENDVTIRLAPQTPLETASLGRVGRPSSACGVCGREQIEELLTRTRPAAAGVRVAAAVLAALPADMARRQAVFRRTGGLHAAALATTTGELVSVREDVGRHNAVDKVVGNQVLGDLAADLLIVSGRAGFEIVQKAAMAGIAVVAAVSAPTSLAVEVADACGITLAAFVRDGRMTVYSRADRIDREHRAASSW